MKADRKTEGRAGLDRIHLLTDARPSVPGERRRTVGRYRLPAVILLAGIVVHLAISHATDSRVVDELRNRTHATVVAIQSQVGDYEDAV